MNIPVKRRSAKPAGWPAPQEGGKYQQRRSAQTDGIDVHNRLKGRVQRKYPLDPGHADAANSDDGQTGRNKRNAKASKIPGLNFVQHAEKMGGYHGHQPYITDVHHRRVTVKNGQQRPAEEENGGHGHGKRPGCFRNGNEQCPAAAAQISRAIILAGKCGASLIKGTENIISKDLNIQGRAGGGHHHRSQTVDSELDHDIGERKHSALQPGRQSNPQNFTQADKIDSQQAGLHMNIQLGRSQPAIQQQGADGVGNHRCDRYAVYRQVQPHHKKQVQQYVQDARKIRASSVTLVSPTLRKIAASKL